MIISKSRLAAAYLLPLLFPKYRVLFTPRRDPQKLIVRTIGHFRASQRRINSLIAQRDLVLLVIMDVRRVFHDSQEDGYRIARQLRLREARKCGVVECLSSLRCDLQGSATGSAFMVGEFHAVNVCFCDTGEFPDNLGDFGGCPVTESQISEVVK